MSSKRKILGSREIYILIDVWKEHINKLKGVHRNSHVYQAMCTQMEKQYGIQLKPPELRMRLNNLTKKYRAERAKTCKSGSSSSQWQYYGQIHNVIGAYKSVYNKEHIKESTENWLTDSDVVIEENSFVVDELASTQSYESSPASVTPELPIDSIPGPSSAKKRKTNTEFLDVLKKDQEIMEHFLKQSLENDKNIISLLQENNKLLTEILKK